MLRFNGIGERVTFGMYNNDRPSAEQKDEFYTVARWAAQRGMGLTAHWHNDGSIGQLLDVFERVNSETPIADLRWSVAHLNDASGPTLQRMKALGVGWAMQNAMYFDGERFAQRARRRTLRIARRRSTPPARRRGDGRRHRCASRHDLQPVRRAALAASTARRSAAPRCAALKRAPPASKHCGSIRAAAHGSRMVTRDAARSNSANSPILPCYRPTTSPCRPRASAKSNRSSRWLAGGSCMRTRLSRNSRTDSRLAARRLAPERRISVSSPPALQTLVTSGPTKPNG